MFRILINMNIFYKMIVLFLIGLARHAQITWVNLQYFYDNLKKEVTNEVRDLTALACSNAALTIIHGSPSFDPFTLPIWNPYQVFSSLDYLFV